MNSIALTFTCAGRVGSAVDVTAGIWVGGGDRAQVDHMAATACHHARHDGARAVHEPSAVGVEHLLPLAKIGALGGFEAKRDACVVDQDVYLGEVSGQAVDRAVDRGVIANVEFDGQHASTKLASKIG